MTTQTLENLRKQIGQAQPFVGIKTPFKSAAGGHVQTLLGHFLPQSDPQLEAGEKIELDVANGDRIVGFKFQPRTDFARGLIHVFHGLAGSSESFYVPRAARVALDLGYTVVLWNHRGCGAGRALALEPYHSGRSDDLARVVRWGRETSSREEKFLHGVLGYSLSANAACLLAAQVVPALDTKPLANKDFDRIGALPDFAIAINPPFDLKLAAERLSRGPSRIYGQSFMPALTECLADRKDWTAEDERRRLFVDLATKAYAKLSYFDNVMTFDAAYTGPASGFRDNFDYYERASSGRYLQATKIPLVILSAQDDPITNGFKDLPEEKFPFTDNPFIVVDAQSEGGHMGYVDRSTLTSAWKKHARWLERRIEMYLKSFLPIVSALLVTLTLSGCSLVAALRSGPGPSETSRQEGWLIDCPVDPNCVSTQAQRGEQAIVPFTYSKPMAEARESLKTELAKLTDMNLVKEDGPYLHFECRSRVLRLIDDIEFLFDEESKTLQFRSASRFGYSDWGTNRKRMEDIRNKILGHI